MKKKRKTLTKYHPNIFQELNSENQLKKKNLYKMKNLDWDDHAFVYPIVIFNGANFCILEKISKVLYETEQFFFVESSIKETFCLVLIYIYYFKHARF